jgi:hypothetical protein
MENEQEWIAQQKLLLDEKAQGLTAPHQTLMGVDFIKGALGLMPEKIQNPADWEAFKVETAKLISKFPAAGAQKQAKKEYQKDLSLYKHYLMKKYKVVTKGYYLGVWMPLGISIGLPFGLLFNNLALGIPIGIAIGAAIGSYLNAAARKENRII